MSRSLYFSGYNRVYNYTPTLNCSRDIDKFTVSNSIGNGKLTYPVGLLTVDEVMYAGGKRLTGNSTYYLYIKVGGYRVLKILVFLILLFLIIFFPLPIIAQLTFLV